MDKIAVLIPCYNEAATIEKVVRDFRAALPEAVVYVYDNNSTDGTGDIARAAGAVVRRERRQGKGNVIRTMFRDIEARCYLIVDGDDTYPAESAREMADAVLLEGRTWWWWTGCPPPTSPRTSGPFTTRATCWCGDWSTCFSGGTSCTS